MQTSNHFGYSTKVWLTSVFFAPFLIALFFTIMEPQSELISMIPIIIGIGFVFSIPNWLLLILFVWQINRSNLPNEEKKTVISFIALFLTLGLFQLISGGASEAMGFAIPYIIVLIIGIWRYELIPPIKEAKQSTISKRVKVLEDILDDENY